jgi:hypothetical protein
MDGLDEIALNRLADLIVDRLRGRLGPRGGAGLDVFGPSGEPVPGLPDLPGSEIVPNLFAGARLAIEGIELTQSIQHYGSGYGADNSVPIVALKPMAARVYAVVRRGVVGADALSGQRVTGSLVLTRSGKEIFRTGPTRADGARLGSSQMLRRELWDTEITAGFSSGGLGSGAAAGLVLLQRNAPLNFVVPAWYLRKGRMNATVLLQAESGATASRDIDFEVIDVPAPKVALVRVNWTSSANVRRSPTDAAMLGTIRLAERMLPFPYFATTILGVEEEVSGNFWMPAATGDCNTQWNDLLAELAQTRAWCRLFQLADIVYGVVPSEANEAPAGSVVNSGCGDSDNGVGACFAGLGRTFAHEIGHIYGREHVAVPNDPDNDPNYPRYGGDPRAIGEIGVDLGSSPVAVYSPPSSNDIMAYFDSNSPDDQKWISPYTYRALIDERYRHASAAANAARFRSFLVARFRVHRLVGGGSEVEIKAMHRVQAPGEAGTRARYAHTDARQTVYIDFVDGRDRVLHTHVCREAHTMAAGGCCGSRRSRSVAAWLDIVEAVPWPEGEVTRLIIRKGDETLDELAVGKPPRVRIEVRHSDQDVIDVEVSARHQRTAPATVLLFSHDDGSSWEPVSLSVPPEGVVKVPANRLRGGPRCRFRVSATSELQAAQADSEPFALELRGRALHLQISAPRCADESALLRAFIDTRGHEMCLPNEVRWHSSIDGELGFGLDLAVALGEGRHVITATIPDGIGGRLTETGIIVVGGRP